jgi:hypothetical protein
MRKLQTAAALAVWIASAAAHTAPQDADEPLALQAADPAESMLALQQDERWGERLLDADLDRREHHYAHLLDAVRRAPELRGMLARWAADGTRPELAWTARLALRELAHQPAWVFGGGQNQRGFGPANPWFSPRQQGPEAPPQAPAQAGRTKMNINVGPDGVRVDVEREVDGERVVESFEASTLQDLKEQYPDLASRIPFSGWVAVPSGAPAPADLWKQRAEGVPTVRTDKLGVEVRAVAADERAFLGLAEGVGVTITNVARDTIASSLGLRAGQVLISVNDHALKSDADIAAGLALREPDGEVRVRLVDRWGRMRTRAWSPAAPAPSAPPVDVGVSGGG